MNLSTVLEKDFSNMLEDLKNESSIMLDIQLAGQNPTCNTMRSGTSYNCNSSSSGGGSSGGGSTGGSK